MIWIEILKAAGITIAIGAVLGILLAVANKYLKVKTDDRIEKVTEMLPNANCGSCGYAGCAGMAEALVKGEAKKVSQCRPSKPENRQKIKEYLENTPGPDGTTVKVDL